MSSFNYPPTSGSSPYFGDPVATSGSLPGSGTTGEVRLVLDTDDFYEWNGSSWERITQNTADVTGPGSSTDNAVARFDSTTGKIIQNSGVIIDNSNNVTGINDLTVNGNFQVDGTTTTVNTATLEVEDANITVNNGGNQSTANTNVAGLTVEMSDATDARIGYDSSTTSKFKAGETGSEAELATISHIQILTNKSIDSDNNTITNIVNDDIKSGAGIAVNKLAAVTASRAVVSDGSGFLTAATTTATEVGYVNGVTSAIQTQINTATGNISTNAGNISTNTTNISTNTTNISTNTGNIATNTGAIATNADNISTNTTNISTNTGNIAAIRAIRGNIAISSNVALTDAGLHLVDTSSARSLEMPAAAATNYVVVKDVTGSAQTNPITITTPGSETIDGSSTYVIDWNYGSIILVGDGTNYFVL